MMAAVLVLGVFSCSGEDAGAPDDGLSPEEEVGVHAGQLCTIDGCTPPPTALCENRCTTGVSCDTACWDDVWTTCGAAGSNGCFLPTHPDDLPLVRQAMADCGCAYIDANGNYVVTDKIKWGGVLRWLKDHVRVGWRWIKFVFWIR